MNRSSSPRSTQYQRSASPHTNGVNSSMMQTIYSVVFSNIVAENYIYFYPTLLFVGLCIRLLFYLILGHVPPPKSAYLLDPRNFINGFFAGHSFELYSILYLSMTMILLKYSKSNMKRSLLPIFTNTDNPESSSLQNLKIYSPTVISFRQLIKYVSLFAWIIILKVWFFGNCIFDRIRKITGDHCEFDKDSSFYGTRPNFETCMKQGGEWANNLRLSGHMLVIGSFAYMLYYECLNFYKIYKFNNINQRNQSFAITNRFASLLLTLSLSLICIWILLFIITSIFFHTVFEKIVGLSCAIVIPYFIFVYPRTKQKFSSFSIPLIPSSSSAPSPSLSSSPAPSI